MSAKLKIVIYFLEMVTNVLKVVTKNFQRIMLQEFRTIFRFNAHLPHRGFSIILPWATKSFPN